MNPRRSFVRKVLYLGVIALLLIPLFWLSQPGTTGSKGSRGGPGGQMAQLREKYDLSEAQLGEIDPTSETIKLATLGMRGVATVFLWEKANDYKMKKDWTNLSATLNQLSKLEPHFISVWRHQGWNLSFNVSAEFDDYRDRYRWVMKGIDFLQQGIRYNRREPKLVWDVGWFISQKIGRADEAKQFRRLFKADDDFHGALPLSERDNWLVGKKWFADAEKLVDQGAALGGLNPILFYSKRPLNQMDYAEALEEEGIFEEKAKRAWKLAGEEWNDFGAREINLTPEVALRLNDLERLNRETDQLAKELSALEPGLREKLAAQKRDALTAQEREAMSLPWEKRTAEQRILASSAYFQTIVSSAELARRVSRQNQKAAQTLANRINDLNRKIGILENSRLTVSFESWRRRAKFEQDPAALAAREHIYEGDQAYHKADLITAREEFDKGWRKWRELFDKKEFKGLAADDSLGDELVKILGRYRIILEKRDEPFPENFILADVIDPHMRRLAAQQEDARKRKEFGTKK